MPMYGIQAHACKHTHAHIASTHTHTYTHASTHTHTYTRTLRRTHTRARIVCTREDRGQTSLLDNNGHNVTVIHDPGPQYNKRTCFCVCKGVELW